MFSKQTITNKINRNQQRLHLQLWITQVLLHCVTQSKDNEEKKKKQILLWGSEHCNSWHSKEEQEHPGPILGDLFLEGLSEPLPGVLVPLRRDLCVSFQSCHPQNVSKFLLALGTGTHICWWWTQAGPDLLLSSRHPHLSLEITQSQVKSSSAHSCNIVSVSANQILTGAQKPQQLSGLAGNCPL